MVNGSGHGFVNRPGVKMRLIDEPTVHGTHMAIFMRTAVVVLPEVSSWLYILNEKRTYTVMFVT